jgi:hypothetical protein
MQCRHSAEHLYDRINPPEIGFGICLFFDMFEYNILTRNFPHCVLTEKECLDAVESSPIMHPFYYLCIRYSRKKRKGRVAMEWFAFYAYPALHSKGVRGINLLYTIFIKNKSNAIKIYPCQKSLVVLNLIIHYYQ